MKVTLLLALFCVLAVVVASWMPAMSTPAAALLSFAVGLVFVVALAFLEWRGSW
jgi:hypothetical protein